MADDWPAFLASLPEEGRAAAARLAARFAALGVPEAEVLARSEIEEDAPHLGRLLLLRRIWAEAIAPYDDGSGWIDDAIAVAERAPDAPFAEAGVALRRLLAAGVEAADIAAVARLVAFGAVSDALHVLDEGSDAAAGEDAPGWAVMEIDEEGYLSDRPLDGLHEALLALRRAGGPGPAADEIGDDVLE